MPGKPSHTAASRQAASESGTNAAGHSLPTTACWHDLPEKRVDLSAKEWDQGFWPYYQRERQLLIDAAERTIKDLLGEPAERVDALRAMAAELKILGNDALGPLGEAHVSYWVEEKIEDTARLLLTKAGWKADPFAVVKGIDLIGVRISDGQVYYIEVKARRNAANFLVTKTLEDLRKDLQLQRIEEKANLTIGSAAYEYIQTEFLSRLRREPGRFSSTVSPKNPTSHGFSRLGAVVTGTGNWESMAKLACPCDVSDKNPCALLLLFVEDLEQQFVVLASADRAAKRAQVSSMIAKL